MERDEKIISQLLGQWQDTYTRLTQLFESLSSWAWDKEIALGRNKPKYLMGHFTAVHDRIIDAMELGERFYPQLDELYINQPQNDTAPYEDYASIKQKWIKVNEYLLQRFKTMSMDDWFRKHHYVSEADFAKEPHRNKLAILISRFTHMYLHLGQLRLLKQ